MAKKKKFERRLSRPTLSASLEAVRQGKTIETAAPLEPVSDESVDEAEPASTAETAEAAFVKSEIKKIGLIMSSLIGLLVVLSVAESRTGFLSDTASRYIQ